MSIPIRSIPVKSVFDEANRRFHRERQKKFSWYGIDGALTKYRLKEIRVIMNEQDGSLFVESTAQENGRFLLVQVKILPGRERFWSIFAIGDIFRLIGRCR